jgi:hypothetical protein
MKKIFDLIAGACAGLVLLLPIVLVALAVRLTSIELRTQQGRVFFATNI